MERCRSCVILSFCFCLKTTGAAATQYMYPTMHTVAPEMYTTQPHPGYQPADLEAASMIEAAPAEVIHFNV